MCSQGNFESPAESTNRLRAEYQTAQRLAMDGRYDQADIAYAQIATHVELTSRDLTPQWRALVANDRGVLAAMSGRPRLARQHWRSTQDGDADWTTIRQNRAILSGGNPDDTLRTRVAVVSLLFNWPSTGGGTIHTKELCQFLSRDGYAVRHFYARQRSFGVGQVTEPLPYDAQAIVFEEQAWHADAIRERFRRAVDNFDPDWIIVTDSWNTKPLLMEAVSDYPYFLRIAALEGLCPLNNVRLLIDDHGSPQQCDRHQFQEPDVCRSCVVQNEQLSGGLHRAERALAGFSQADYPGRLRHAYRQAAGILVVNPTTAQLVEPFAQSVHVIPSGFDRDRFPVSLSVESRPRGSKTTVLFAGLVDEWMKGFHILQAAADQLWKQRQDFEIVATANPVGPLNAHTRFVGWQSQTELPQVMANADIVVFPTIAQEALGRSAVEAMACGRPVIASRIGGLPWVINDERTGLLFAPGNPDDLAQTLSRLLDDPELRGELGRGGRLSFERRFTWDVILPHYRNVFGAAVRSTKMMPT